MLLRPCEQCGTGFTAAGDQCLRCRSGDDDALVNHTSLGEIETRGRLELGLPAHTFCPDSPATTPVAPQWQAIAAITHTETLLHEGAASEAITLLAQAAERAAALQLPRQVERAADVAESIGSPDGSDLAHHIRSTLLAG